MASARVEKRHLKILHLDILLDIRIKTKKEVRAVRIYEF